jgi:hypothetical protein
VWRSSDRGSRALLAAIATAGLLCGSPARAQSELPTFRLEYTAEDSCPPAGALADRLAARVGYSPVREEGTDLLEIRIEATSAGLDASLRWVDRAGAIVGERQLSAPAGGCEGLLDALAMTVAVQLDGLRAQGAVEPPAEEPVPEAPVEAPRCPEPPEPEAPVETGGLVFERASVRAAATTSLGFGPTPPLGLTIGLALAWSHLSVALELGAATPVVLEQLPSGHTLEAVVYGFDAIVCLPIGPLDACVLGELGVLQGKVLELAAPVPRFSLTFAAGARLAIDHPLGGGAGFFAALDAMVVPLRALVAVDQVPVWEAAPVAGRLSVGLSFGM